ncbi:hypothetical protein D9M68_924480 [compost metagenome]
MVMAAVMGAWPLYILAVSCLTRSRTSSWVRALGATVQPAITAATASTTMLRGRMAAA